MVHFAGGWLGLVLVFKSGLVLGLGLTLLLKIDNV